MMEDLVSIALVLVLVLVLVIPKSLGGEMLRPLMGLRGGLRVRAMGRERVWVRIRARVELRLWSEFGSGCMCQGYGVDGGQRCCVAAWVCRMVAEHLVWRSGLLAAFSSRYTLL